MVLQVEHHLLAIGADLIDVLVAAEHNLERYRSVIDVWKLQQIRR